jgi:hypothetical protein
MEALLDTNVAAHEDIVPRIVEAAPKAWEWYEERVRYEIQAIRRTR